jgi:fructose-1-phosphate kinase PfkB-like protein
MARLAVAAGTATALVEGTGIASLSQVEAMRPRVRVRVL